MVVGYEAVEQMGTVNAVVVDAEELFPRGTVVLGGIKTFGDRGEAEAAIMAASALVKEAGGPLSGCSTRSSARTRRPCPGGALRL